MKAIPGRLLTCLLAVVPAQAAAHDVTAVARLVTANAQLQRAQARGNWRDYLSEARGLVGFLNGSPDAMLEMARAFARLGKVRDALAELRTIAHMGVAEGGLATAPDFAALRHDPTFSNTMALMATNLRPASVAAAAFSLSDAGLLPEDIAYDVPSRRFFVTSVLEKKIVTLLPGGASRTFADAPDGWPMLAVKIDGTHRTLWATEAALTGFRGVSKRDWGRSAVLVYDLDSGRLIRRVEGPPASQFGDMTLAPNGDALLADSNGGGLYLERRNEARLVALDTTNFVSPMTPAFANADNRVFVADYVRGIAMLSLSTRRVTWIAMANHYALQSIDGMYWHHGRLILIQNGITPERVIALTLDSAGTHVVACSTIATGAARLDPNHGVIVRNEFYFIANAGWNQLRADGSVRTGGRLTPALVERVPLGRGRTINPAPRPRSSRCRSSSSPSSLPWHVWRLHDRGS